MAFFRPPPLPQQRPRALPPTVQAAGSAGSVSITSTVQAVAPFGDGSVAVTSTVAAVGASLASGAGSVAVTSTVAAVAASTSIFPLTISSDGRYLKKNDGTPFLIKGDTTWSLFVDIPLTGTRGIDAFLTTITGQGFNAVSGNVIEHHYTVVKPPKNQNGDLPFTKTLNGSTYTGSPNGTTSSNGTQGQFAADNYSNINNQAPDPTFINNVYWQACETILNSCLSHNVAVFVWPFYLGFHAGDEGWMQELVAWDAVTGAGGFTGLGFANATKSKAWNYGAWLADRWKAYPHIIWVAGGDYGSGTQTLDTQQKAAVESVISGMKSVSGQQSVFWTAHWDRDSISTDTSLTSVTFDINGSYCGEAVAERTRQAYAHSPTSPACLIEWFYENDLFGGSPPYRKYMYWGYLGGIAGGLFGNEQIWRFDDGTPGTDYVTLETTQATLDAVRQFAFWDTRPWWRLKPSGLGGMGTIITAGGGTASPQSDTYVTAAATSEGDLLLAYVPPAHTGSITVDMTKMSATAQARWFDPANASFTTIGAFNASGTHAFTPPATNSAGDADFLLVLETPAATVAATSTVAGAGAALASTSGTASVTVGVVAVGSSIAATAGSAAIACSVSAGAASVLTGAGSVAITSTVSGAGLALVAGAGAVTVTGAVAVVGQSAAAGAGSSVLTSTVAAVGQSTAAGAGSSAGTLAVSGAGSAMSVTSGSAASTVAVSAVGTALAAGSGTVAATTTAASTGQSTGSGACTVATTLTTTATGASLAAGAGSSSATFTVAAVGQGISQGSATGNIAMSSAVAATGAALAAGAGSAAITGAMTGVAAANLGAGAVTGTMTLSGTGASIWAGAATVSGSVAVTGFGAGSGTTAGSVAVMSTMAAVGAPLASGTASMTGALTATAVSTSIAMGAGVATGTVTLAAAGMSFAAAASTLSGSFVLVGAAPPAVDPTTAWEDAIYQWVVTGSGLDPGQVIWASAGNGGPAPAGLYISMRIIDVDQVSDDWLIPRRESDGIVHHVRGTRHPTLELRCFAGDSTGARRAELVLSRVMASVMLPSVAKALRQGDVGVGTAGKVRVMPGVRSGLLDPLAMVEVGLHIKIDVSEVGGEFVSVGVTTPVGVGQTVVKT